MLIREPKGGHNKHTIEKQREEDNRKMGRTLGRN